MILPSHHSEEEHDDHDEEDCGCKVEVDETTWEVLLADDDDPKELNEQEKKELLKLHKYFAHRNGSKLWENLL